MLCEIHASAFFTVFTSTEATKTTETSEPTEVGESSLAGAVGRSTEASETAHGWKTTTSEVRHGEIAHRESSLTGAVSRGTEAAKTSHGWETASEIGESAFAKVGHVASEPAETEGFLAEVVARRGDVEGEVFYRDIVLALDASASVACRNDVEGAFA